MDIWRFPLIAAANLVVLAILLPSLADEFEVPLSIK
jgi:hypothetical protein